MDCIRISCTAPRDLEMPACAIAKAGMFTLCCVCVVGGCKRTWGTLHCHPSSRTGVGCVSVLGLRKPVDRQGLVLPGCPPAKGWRNMAPRSGAPTDLGTVLGLGRQRCMRSALHSLDPPGGRLWGCLTRAGGSSSEGFYPRARCNLPKASKVGSISLLTGKFSGAPCAPPSHRAS